MPPVSSFERQAAGPAQSEQELVRFAQMIGTLTTAIDLAEGNREGHALRTCIIGMKIGRRIGLDSAALSDLYYALLLKDIAGSHTQSLDMELTGQGGLQARRLLREGRSGMSWREAARAAMDLHGTQPWVQRMRRRFSFFHKRNQLRQQTVALRCDVGDNLLRTLGVSERTRLAVLSVDEEWDGDGAPNGIRGREIPTLAQTVKLAQMMEFFHAQGGGKRVVQKLHRRCRGWFDPGLVAAATRLFESPSSWWLMDQKDLVAYTAGIEPRELVIMADTDTVDRVCEVFAEVADARSNYSHKRSARVADLAVRMAHVLHLHERETRTLRRAALLQGLGKLVMPRHILEREGSLSEDERAVLETYPLRTFEILQRVPELSDVARVAMSHHERLDGSGYPHGLKGNELDQSSRILAVADVAEALASERSFRKEYSGQEMYQILMEMTPHQLDVHCVNALLHNSVISLVA